MVKPSRDQPASIGGNSDQTPIADDRVAVPGAISAEALGSIAKAARNRRRIQQKLLGIGLVSNAGWDILLAITISEGAGRLTSPSTIARTTRISPSTVLRYCLAMEDVKLVYRTADPRDARRINIRLTDEGRRKMEASLQ